MSRADLRPTAIDLFSGAGGLSLGLKRAGFRVVAAVEISEEVAATYKKNHPEVKVLTKSVTDVTAKALLRAAGVEHVDLVAGCPPCQGFSKLTDKYTRKDPRNQLVGVMARLAVALKPKVVMMENVPGLAIRGKRLLNDFLVTLEDAGYLMDWQVLQLADYGVPQSRRRLVAMGGLDFTVPMPQPTHSRQGDDGRPPWRTLREALGQTGRPVSFTRARREGGPQAFEWHVVGDLKPISKDRLRALKAGNNRVGLPRELRPRCHRKKDEGFTNVYGRMSWNRTPPTITGGCTTPCKGRFGHPTQLRTISVREAALIQTFPRRYRFVTDKMMLVCEMVGNALPPKFAKVAARQCMVALGVSDPPGRGA